MGAKLSKEATAEEVKARLEELGAAFKPYAAVVVENGIDGEMLGAITEADLGDLEIVIKPLHKKKLLKEIAVFVAAAGGGGEGGAPGSPVHHVPAGTALMIHITYSREDSELVMKVQDAARKAKWEISGIMSNQGKEWFAAWIVALRKSRGVCVFFTKGNAKVLNNHGVGYRDKFATRMQSHGDQAPLYMEAMAILALKAERPEFKIYVIDGVNFTPEQLAFNLMNDAPSFGPVDKWQEYIEGGWREHETIFDSMANMSVSKVIDYAFAITPHPPLSRNPLSHTLSLLACALIHSFSCALSYTLLSCPPLIPSSHTLSYICSLSHPFSRIHSLSCTLSYTLSRIHSLIPSLSYTPLVPSSYTL
jgi:hypothetical protein